MFEAKTVMTKEVITVQPDTPVVEAVRLLVKFGISGLPVVDDNKNLVGLLSEKDALQLLQASEPALAVSDYMTKNVVHFDENDSLIEICNCLIEKPFRRVPITSGGKKLVGVISRRDIMKKILEIRRISLEDLKLAGEDA